MCNKAYGEQHWLNINEYVSIVELVLFAKFKSLPSASWINRYIPDKNNALQRVVDEIISEFDSWGFFWHSSEKTDYSKKDLVRAIAKKTACAASESKWLRVY